MSSSKGFFGLADSHSLLDTTVRPPSKACGLGSGSRSWLGCSELGSRLLGRLDSWICPRYSLLGWQSMPGASSSGASRTTGACFVSRCWRLWRWGFIGNRRFRGFRRFTGHREGSGQPGNSFTVASTGRCGKLFLLLSILHTNLGGAAIGSVMPSFLNDFAYAKTPTLHNSIAKR